MANKSNQIHILFVIESLHCGGAEKSLVTLLQNIDFETYHVDLIIMNPGGEFEKFLPSEVNLIVKNQFSRHNFFRRNIKRVHFLLLRKANRFMKYHGAQLYWKAFGSFISKHDTEYDIAIAYNQGFSTYYVANKVVSKKKFAWLNTDYQKAGYNITFDITHYKSYDKVICVSKENELSFKNAVSEIDEKIKVVVIKDIVDADFVKKMSSEKIDFEKNDEDIVIVTVGRLAKAKGLDMAVEACAMLREKGLFVKWYVIGDGPERNELEKLIKIKGIQDSFLLLGFKENPFPYMQLCDIYVQTSLFEGLGMTVIEASVLNKPIVTTNFSTAFSIIEHNKTGKICEMTSVAITDTIIEYVENVELMQEVSENLSHKDNYDKEISLQKFKKLIVTS